MAKHEVVLFLKLVLQACESGRLTYRKDRPKNAATLIDLGWCPSDMYSVVARLRPEQALGLPWDNGYSQFARERVCEFGLQIDGRDIYVKVSIVGDESGAAGCVFSFHFAEKPFAFPFKR